VTFRPFFRNSYAYQLDWDQMQPLVLSISDTWNDLRSSLGNLIDEQRRGGDD